MLNMFYEINSEYRDKNIYIWDVCRNSMSLFTKLAFGSKMVSGFVTDIDKYIGNKFLNLPVIGADDYPDNGSILVLPDYPDTCRHKVYEKVLKMLPNAKIVWHEDLYDVAGCLLHEKVMIYGTGTAAEQILDVCKEKDVLIDGFFNSNAESNETFKGYPVFSSKDLWKFTEYPIIVAALNIESKEEIINNLSNNNCERIYVNHVIDPGHSFMEAIFTWINKAICDGKKIYIYSDYNEYLKITQKTFETYGILINGIVYEKSDGNNFIEDVYTLSYMNPNDIFIYINERIPGKMQQANRILRDLGMDYENFTGAIQSRTNYSEWKTNMDILLGSSLRGNTEKKGFYIYGKDKQDDLKIMILGGSTSTEKAYTTESWVSKMYNKYFRNKNVIIYNGANCGFDVAQELLVLLRDGPVIKPNIVISLSGVNNLFDRSELPAFRNSYFGGVSFTDVTNNFNVLTIARWLQIIAPQSYLSSGLASDEENFEFWKRNEKIICEVARIIGAKPYIFLQPMNIDEENMDMHEYSLHIAEQHREAQKEFLSGCKNNDFYINAINLLLGKDKMYIDAAHYTDEANEIIATYVYEKIKNAIGEC